MREWLIEVCLVDGNDFVHSLAGFLKERKVCPCGDRPHINTSSVTLLASRQAIPSNQARGHTLQTGQDGRAIEAPCHCFTGCLPSTKRGIALSVTDGLTWNDIHDEFYRQV